MKPLSLGSFGRVAACVLLGVAALINAGVSMHAEAAVLAASGLSTDTPVAYRTAEVDGIRIFYRESGPKDAPAALLTHGFPASSREKLRGWLTADGIRLQYTAGLPAEQIASLSLDTWNLDWALLSRPGNIDVQLDLFGDYQTNVALYPEFQAFFRERQPPTLIVWGSRDPFFTVEGAKAYSRDIPDAELHLLDAGHFALETKAPEIAMLIRDFLARVSKTE